MANVSAAAHSFGETDGDTVYHRPVDLVHLARHTLGNRDLEREILQIFVRQSALYMDRLRGAKTGTERQMAAHTIKGSARGIGAWEVADLAEVIESRNGAREAIKALAASIEKTNRFISGLLSDYPED